MAPNIREYESTSDLTPSDKGIQAAQDAARMYARTGEEIGRDIGGGIRAIGNAVEKHMTFMETSELYKTAPQIELSLKQRYDQLSALPENRANPHFSEIFLGQEVDPILEQWHVSVSTPQGKELAMRLKADMRNSITRHAYAGQSAMDTEHSIQNLDEGLNSLKADVAYDPSEANYNTVMGKADNMIQAATALIPDVEKREETALYYSKRGREELTAARYEGALQAVTNQVRDTNSADGSPAYAQIMDDIKNKLGHEYMDLSGLPKQLEQAVTRGQQLYSADHETAKSALVTEGKAVYSDIHNAITNLALENKGPTPELVQAIQLYARKYGATNPGEAASLDDYVLKGQDRAQAGRVESYDQKVRDSIQNNMSRPVGDPRRPTLASLTKAWSSGQITKEDLGHYTEILTKLDHPEKDPTFGPAYRSFKQWQNLMVQHIGVNNRYGVGAAVARAQFLHDSEAVFMGDGRHSGNWEGVLNQMTDPHNVSGQAWVKVMLPAYNKAALSTDPAGYIQKNLPTFSPDGSATPARGSVASPIYPTKNAPAQPTAIDQKTADEIIWGKH